MQVKNADGTIINIKSKVDVENPIKDIDNTIGFENIDKLDRRIDKSTLIHF